MKINLNDLGHDTDLNIKRPMDDFSTSGFNECVEVIFRGIRERLVQEIHGSRIVVGCVAWLTCHDILDALASVSDGVSLIVQKEDFLRPDLDDNSDFGRLLREKYRRIKSISSRYHFDILGNFSTCNGDGIDAVRCVGNINDDRDKASPRMHNKFIVFCDWAGDVGQDPDDYGLTVIDRIIPKKVWTGSFNFSKNAGYSLENALILKDSKICWAYFKEYQNIAGLSEPLNWESKWVSPEWRIGT